MINDIIKSIATDLKSVYPDKNIYSEEIPEGANDSFFIDIEKISYERATAHGKKMTVSVGVYYLCNKDNNGKNVEYFKFTENMTNVLDEITALGRNFKTNNHEAERSDVSYRFKFNVSIQYAVESKKDYMEKLYQERGVKNE